MIHLLKKTKIKLVVEEILYLGVIISYDGRKKKEKYDSQTKQGIWNTQAYNVYGERHG